MRKAVELVVTPLITQAPFDAELPEAKQLLVVRHLFASLAIDREIPERLECGKSNRLPSAPLLDRAGSPQDVVTKSHICPQLITIDLDRSEVRKCLE